MIDREVNCFSPERQLHDMMTGKDTIGFYPSAWRKWHNVWIDFPHCPACGASFDEIKHLFATGCSKCMKSFLD